MRVLTLDTEVSCLKLDAKNLNGNPFAEVNKLCYVGLQLDEEYEDFCIEYKDEPYGDALRCIQQRITDADCIVLFNAKFDLHWLRRYGIEVGTKRIYDCQIAEFILQYQENAYPSLQQCCEKYGLPGKLDVVKEQYWKAGLDTEQVPEDILREYLKQDVQQTYAVYLAQQSIIPDTKRRLISLANQDLLALLDIERNGMLYDVDLSLTEGNEAQKKIDEIDQKLKEEIGFPDFNPGSGDHISAVLYGGSIKTSRQVLIGTYKTGQKAGQPKYKWEDELIPFEQLVKPLKNSELKKEGYYATNSETLVSLKATGKAKKIIALLLERSTLEKLVGTYLHGLPRLIQEQGWSDNMIHGNLNQCVAITGRLSSSKPNMQNLDKSIAYLFRSRYD